MIKITDQVESVFKENPLYSKDGQGKDAKVIARFFIPGTSMQWLVLEATEVNGRWLLYGCSTIVGVDYGYIFFDYFNDLKICGKPFLLECFENNEQRPLEYYIKTF